MGRCAAVITLAVFAAAAGCGTDTPELPGRRDGVVAAFGETGDEVPSVPELLVTDDGDVIMRAPTEFASQGELLPDLWTQTITPAGIAALRRAAGSLGGFDEGRFDDGRDLATVVGAGELGAIGFYLPAEYLFAAMPTTPVADRPVLEWPERLSVRLADASTCTRLPESDVGELFETAAAGSLFADDGIVYDVVVQQGWPGADC